MSEPIRLPMARPGRTERTTTSCGECRRRKQKCNQGHPCSNCARRFPQPVCEYKTGVTKRRSNATAVTPPRSAAFRPSLSPPNLTKTPGFSGEAFREPTVPYQSPLLPVWNRQSNTDGVNGILSNWLGFGFLDQSSIPPPTGQYAWSTDQHSLSIRINACEDGCTAHSDEVHDAIQLLLAYQSAQNPWVNSNWIPGYSTWTLVPTVPTSACGISWPLVNPAQEFAQMPLSQPMQNSDLISIYIKFLAQFTASLDGKPDSSNQYIKHYVPYCLNSQLLVHVAIYSAACFLTDTGHVERTVAMAHKGHVFKLLNEHIRSQVTASDEVIAAVVQLVVNEWLWGHTNDVWAHLRGLRQMIKSRGGFRTLGLHGLISKLAITSDVAIALYFEASPFLQGGSEFEFPDNTQIPLRVALNTPLISSLVAFSSCFDALHIHPAVASILDDMRFLLATVLALPKTPSAKELQKVHTTSAWIHERITGLPENSPAARRRPSAASSSCSAAVSSGCSPGTETGVGQQQQASTRGQQQQQQQQRQRPPRSRRTSAQHPQQPPQSGSSPQRTPDSDDDGEDDDDSGPDYVYQAVRLAALLYSRAIRDRQPFSRVVTPAEFLRLWTTAVWRVPLSTWRSLLGVLNWVLLPLLPSGKAAQPHDRFVKAVLKLSLFQMGLDNWDIASSVMQAALSLQGWLAGGGGSRAGGDGRNSSNVEGTGGVDGKSFGAAGWEEEGRGYTETGAELYAQAGLGC